MSTVRSTNEGVEIVSAQTSMAEMHDISKNVVEADCCTEIANGLLNPAEKELSAFISAVTELYGAEQSMLSAGIWLSELESLNGLPGPASRDWRRITIAALVRLARRLADSKVSTDTIVQLFRLRGSDVMRL